MVRTLPNYDHLLGDDSSHKYFEGNQRNVQIKAVGGYVSPYKFMPPFKALYGNR